jgi:geranylgeranyl reductase family protein
MSRLDVLVVGAGPAGSWTAHQLARAGARVAILDPSHPREKPCGGGLTGRTLEVVAPALPPQNIAAVPIAGAGFTYAGGSARVPLEPDASAFPPLIVAGRREFDRALLSAATDAGADHKPLRVIGLHRRDGGWRVEAREGSWDCRWLIGADGANSLVRRHVARAFPRSDLSIASGYFVHGRSSPDIEVAFDHEPAGYLWSFPRPDHLAVGVCAQADVSDSTTLSAVARRWIDGQGRGGGTLTRYSWPIPSLSEAAIDRERPAGDGWMLVGDAAGLVDPITREGIYFALRSGELAAEALIAGRGAAAAYEHRLRSEIFAELRRAAHIKARFYQPQFMSLLIRALQRSRNIRSVMGDLVAGRQSYRGLRWRLLKSVEWRLMLDLFGMG